jgi:hypothetical protein
MRSTIHDNCTNPNKTVDRILAEAVEEMRRAGLIDSGVKKSESFETRANPPTLERNLQ